MKTEAEVFQEGADAYHAGKGPENPYPYDAKRHDETFPLNSAWFNGWVTEQQPAWKELRAKLGEAQDVSG